MEIPIFRPLSIQSQHRNERGNSVKMPVMILFSIKVLHFSKSTIASLIISDTQKVFFISVLFWEILLNGNVYIRDPKLSFEK